MTVRSAPASSKHVVALDYEIAQEQTAALGRLGRALEAALAALAEHDGVNAGPTSARRQLVAEAGDALWHFMVQREAVGLRDQRQVIRDYQVPAEVQNRMGVFAGRRTASR